MTDYERRKHVYDLALHRFGDRNQMIVGIEELSEAQKEICKFLRGEGNTEHLAEEVADAAIMLEQLINIFQIGELVQTYMGQKVERLSKKVRPLHDYGERTESGLLEDY